MEKILEILQKILIGDNIITEIARIQPYGIVYKTAEIEYLGMKGRLVWDYILYNELTFEDIKTGKKYSLATSWSDKKTEKIFNEFVEKYGV